MCERHMQGIINHNQDDTGRTTLASKISDFFNAIKLKLVEKLKILKQRNNIAY